MVPDRDPGGLSLVLPDADLWLRSKKRADPTADSTGEGEGTVAETHGTQGGQTLQANEGQAVHSMVGGGVRGEGNSAVLVNGLQGGSVAAHGTSAAAAGPVAGSASTTAAPAAGAAVSASVGAAADDDDDDEWGDFAS